MERSDDGTIFLKALSNLLGFVYFLCWSLSFYPQPLLNWRRKSTAGTAIDFPFINMLGFAAYTTSNAVFLFSPVVRRQYAVRHPRSPSPTVRVIDFIFAAHGFVLCVITYSQFYPRLWGFTARVHQRTHRLVLGIFWGGLLGVVLTALLVAAGGRPNEGDPSAWAWIDVIYAVSYIKIVATVVKYCPQVAFNYRRKSTKGWSIWQILLDFAGGILSVTQLGIDSSLQGETVAGIVGNPVKFLLGNVSIIFDIIFMTQHYILYGEGAALGTSSSVREDEDEPLLYSNGDGQAGAERR